MEKLPPPPSRTPDSIRSRPDTPEQTPGQKRKAWWAAKGKVWGDRAQGWSDSVGARVNDFAERRLGTEAFYPVTGDLPKEMDKAARILKAFTEEGIVTTEKGAKGKKRVLRKIPPKVIKQAKGLAIFTSMRSGIAPLGGAGGAGVVVAKLPDGSWSAPSSITPNNLSTGLLLGVDIYDCILVINTQKALDSFGTHKFTLGTELAVVAGPWGAGAAVEAGVTDRSPVFSYVKSRGLYAGVEVVGQVFVERFDENGAMYHWPGIKARDILTGKVPVPIEAGRLQAALKDAESGRAQSRTLGGALEAEVNKDGIPLAEMPLDELTLDDGEVLRLPPTPDMTDGHECESDPETEEIIRRSGMNPPALPPRRRPGTAPPKMDPSSETENAEASTSAAPLVQGVPPPLPHRPGEMPPSYDASEGVADMAYDAPDGPPPHVAAALAAAAANGPPPLPARAPGHTMNRDRSPTSPHSPLSPTVVTPSSPSASTHAPPRPTTPELMALGAPAEMEASERREWEQAFAERMGGLSVKDNLGKEKERESESLL